MGIGVGAYCGAAASGGDEDEIEIVTDWLLPSLLRLTGLNLGIGVGADGRRADSGGVEDDIEIGDAVSLYAIQLWSVIRHILCTKCELGV